MKRPLKRDRAGAGHADPLEADTLGKVDATYREPSTAATVTKFPLGRKNLRSTAAIRLSELVRLAQGRRSYGLRVDPHLFAWTLAATLGSATAGTYPIAKRQRCVRWYGLTLESLRIAINRAEIGKFSDEELLTILRDIERGQAAHGPGLIGPAKLADLLQVTAGEREAFSLRTIEACDEPREARKARQAERRKNKDAERKRAERGCIPWAVYQSHSLSATKPWENEGVSRRTWERRRKRDANLSTHVLESQGCVDTIATGAASSTPDGSAGAARRGSAKRSVSAGGPSPSAQTSKGTSDRDGRAAAFSVPELSDPGSEPPMKRSENLAVMFPEKAAQAVSYVSEPGAVIAAIDQAAEILRTQRKPLRGRQRDRLDEVLVLLSGMRLLVQIEGHVGADDAAETIAVAVECGVRALRSVADNDNRIGAVIRTLAA